MGDADFEKRREYARKAFAEKAALRQAERAEATRSASQNEEPARQSEPPAMHHRPDGQMRRAGDKLAAIEAAKARHAAGLSRVQEESARRLDERKTWFSKKDLDRGD